MLQLTPACYSRPISILALGYLGSTSSEILIQGPSFEQVFPLALSATSSSQTELDLQAVNLALLFSLSLKSPQKIIITNNKYIPMILRLQSKGEPIPYTKLVTKIRQKCEKEAVIIRFTSTPLQEEL